MSKINNLIKKLCPNGVKYVYLGDIAKLSSGEFVRKDKQVNSGYPVYNGGSTNTGYYSEYNTDENKIIMSARGAAGFVNIIKEKFWAGNSCHIIDVQDNNADWQFVYYCLKNMQKSIIGERAEGTIPSVSQKQLKNIRIPLPPLEIQEEIVRILDKFSELETEIEADLGAELEARKSQYEFWCEKIINNNDNLMKITDVCNTAVGGDVPKENFSSEKTEVYNIPIYSNSVDKEGLYGYTNIEKINKPCVTLSGRGAGVGHAFLRLTPFFPIIRLVCLIPKEELITAEYLYYAIQLVKFRIPTTGIPQLTVPMVSEYEIPVPSLEEQKRIVKILNKFDRTINDISENLTVEIELRRKQYEYYRNKLLSFEELSVSE